MESLTTVMDDGFNTTGNETNNPQPTPSGSQGALEIMLLVTIALGMFGIGCGVERQRLLKHFKKPTGAVIGIVSQFIVMPVVSLIFVYILQMSAARSLALLIIGSCPGGTISNVVVVFVEGDVDLSVSMTTASSLVAFAVMPLLLVIYSAAFPQSLTVPFDAIAINLGLVLGPIAVGILFRWKFERLAKILVKVLSAIVLIGSITYAVLAFISYSGFLIVSTEQIISAAFVPIIGMSLGYGLASLVGLYKPLWLEHYQRRTIAIETGIQNVQVASGIILLANFAPVDLGQTLLHPFLYFVSQIIWIVVLIAAFKVYERFGPNSGSRDLDQKDTKESKKKEKQTSAFTNNSFKKEEYPMETQEKFSKL